MPAPLLAFAIGAALPAMFMIFKSNDLRPIADDYCSGARVATHGILGGTTNFFMTWHGGLAADVLTSVFAWPLIAFPWWAAYIPFLVLIFSLITASSAALLGWGWSRAIKGRLLLAVLAPISLLAWMALFWGAGTDREALLAYSAIGWQAASFVHLVPVLLSVLLLVYCLASPTIRRRGDRWAAALGGVVVGAFSMPESLATAATLILAGVFVVPVLGAVYRDAARRLFIAGSGSFLSGAVIYFAPGTQVRAELMPQFTPSAAVAQVIRTVVTRFQPAWGDAIAVPGLYVAFLIFVPVGLLLGLGSAASERSPADWVPTTQRRLCFVAVLAVVYGFFSTVSALAGEALTYAADWHRLAPVCALFFGAAAGGSLAGLWLSQLSVPRMWQVTASSLILLGALGLGVRNAHAFGEHVDARKTAWDAGPAPLGYMVDREVAWPATCWRQLVRAR